MLAYSETYLYNIAIECKNCVLLATLPKIQPEPKKITIAGEQ